MADGRKTVESVEQKGMGLGVEKEPGTSEWNVPTTTLALVPQPVRATYVQVDGAWDGVRSGGRAMGHVSRKSHHVLVETV